MEIFAYIDGSFSNIYNNKKDVVGIVFKRDPIIIREGEEKVLTGYQKIRETDELVGYKLSIDGVENVVLFSDLLIEDKAAVITGTKTSSSMSFGLYSENGTNGHRQGNGFNKSVIGPKIIEAIHEKFPEELKYVDKTSVFDIPTIPNFNGNFLLDSKGNKNDYFTDDTYLEKNEDKEYIGFKDYENVNVGVNQWIDYTKQIVDHVNLIFESFLVDVEYNQNNGEEMIKTSITDVNTGKVHRIINLPKNNKELANILYILKHANNSDDAYLQFMYPAAYSCYLYEPELKNDIEIHEQYKQKKWHSPTIGELSRIYHFYRISRGGNGQLPNSDYSVTEDNFKELPEFKKPIYAQALRRSQGSVPYIHSASRRWSCFEHSEGNAWFLDFSSGGGWGDPKYGSGLVRPVVAFFFRF